MTPIAAENPAAVTAAANPGVDAVDAAKAKAEKWRAIRRARVDALREKLPVALQGRSDIVLELGCGHGHFLSAYAAANPGRFCLGIDLLSHRIQLARRKRDRGNLANLDFFKADVFEFLEAFPDNVKLSAIFIIYPDPWPKARHHKNRMIQETMLTRLAELSVPGGTRLHFRTDSADYFEWTGNMLSKHPAWEILPDEAWPFEAESFFSRLLPDKKSLAAGRVAAA